MIDEYVRGRLIHCGFSFFWCEVRLCERLFRRLSLDRGSSPWKLVQFLERLHRWQIDRCLGMLCMIWWEVLVCFAFGLPYGAWFVFVMTKVSSGKNRNNTKSTSQETSKSAWTGRGLTTCFCTPRPNETSGQTVGDSDGNHKYKQKSERLWEESRRWARCIRLTCRISWKQRIT